MISKLGSSGYSLGHRLTRPNRLVHSVFDRCHTLRLTVKKPQMKDKPIIFFSFPLFSFFLFYKYDAQVSETVNKKSVKNAMEVIS